MSAALSDRCLQITKNIVNVEQAAKNTSLGAVQAQTAGNELAVLSEQLRSLVGQFKV
jgi:methyl-accepting chemotaxis protein